MSAESYGNVYIKAKSDIADMISVSLVKSVGVRTPVYAINTDTDYLNEKKPGLYPDLLVPVYEKYGVEIEPGKLTSLWIQVDIPEYAKAGAHNIEVSVCDRENELASEVFTLEIIDAVLPAGDTFCVYPAPDGTAFSSLHYKGFAQALFDKSNASCRKACF